MNYNALGLTVYSSGTTILSGSPLRLAEQIKLTKYYPGGIYGSLDFFVPADVTVDWRVRNSMRVVAWNGLTPVWEGYIVQIGPEVTATTQGWRVLAIGAWAHIVMPQTWNKPWAETRIDEDVWWLNTASPASEKCTLDRENRLRFTPKSESWVNTEFVNIGFAAPTGQTIKRVTFGYDMQEGGQAWTLGLSDYSISLWSVTASGTGTQDIALGTPAAAINFYFIANANQTPTSDGTYYGQVSGIVVYTETGSINLTEVAKDIRAHLTELSAYDGLIGSNTYELTPCICAPGQYLGDFLLEMAAFGDSSFNAWAVGVKGSWLGTDNLPVLFAEQYPALTDYDYHIRFDRMDEAQFLTDSTPGEVVNRLGATYRLNDGRSQVVSWDDDAALTDATSVTAYGKRDEWLDVDSNSLGNVKNHLKRILAGRKDIQVKASNTIPVVGYIRAKNGAIIPACEIEPGKRLRIDNYLGQVGGTDPIFLITSVDYDDASQTARLGVGRPDPLDMYLAQRDAKRS